VKDLAVVADTHLVRHDDELSRFVAFLDSLAGRTEVLYHLGDVFNIWLGSRRFEMEHMTPVLEAMRRLAASGTALRLVEGNRDFHVEDGYAGDPFEKIVPDTEERDFSGRRLHFAHGDLVNEADRQYRAWRRFSRSRPLWGAFRLLPGGRGVALGSFLETRLRGTNVRHKSYFPKDTFEAYGRRLVASGVDRVLLGHIHVEKVLEIEAGPRRGRLIVLPDWRSSHRYYRFGADGTEGFVDFTG
jgi:UDP-2,3-diacylglucosamine hydrolase